MTFCDIKRKDLKSKSQHVLKMVKGPCTHICGKCLRVANNDKYLCKGVALNQLK